MQFEGISDPICSTTQPPKPPDPIFILRGHNGGINSVKFHNTNPDLLISG